MTIRSRFLVGLAATGLIFSACSAGAPASQTAGSSQPASSAPADSAPAGEAAAVSLQLQWTPQAQFAGYFAADGEGYYTAEDLDVELLAGGPDIQPHIVGSDPNGPEFTIAWVPKVLELRDKGQSDLVDIAQVFQRSGTRSVSWKETNITSPEDFADKKVGVWDFGNDYEVIAAGRKVGLEPNEDYERVIQDFNMELLLDRQIDVSEAMIYNEYAQVLETENPDTGELYQADELNVIDYNEVGTAMLQDAIWAREAWLAESGNEDVAERFLRASFRGWIFCRDNPDECIQYTVDAGSTLGAGHQAWMMNEINPLIWPSEGGVGAMPEATWDQTVQIAVDAGIIKAAPSEGAYRTDLAEAAREGITEDANGADFAKGTVEVTPGGN
ncbi:MAG: ABC transporter substrate-binding protein [Chloroflexi bacterium]|nr:ABC transporter substrate-binding protein [Chloroflexota bacterium]